MSAILLLPVFFGIIFTIVQAAGWAHAGNIAQSIAATAYHESSSYQSTESAGLRAGNELAAQTSKSLQNTQISIVRSATTVTVTVTGTTPNILFPNVSRTFTGPIERWVN